MAKWLGILVAVMLAAAIVGFLVDAVRFIAGALFVGCLLVLLARTLTKLSWRRSPNKVGAEPVQRIDRT